MYYERGAIKMNLTPQNPHTNLRFSHLVSNPTKHSPNKSISTVNPSVWSLKLYILITIILLLLHYFQLYMHNIDFILRFISNYIQAFSHIFWLYNISKIYHRLEVTLSPTIIYFQLKYLPLHFPDSEYIKVVRTAPASFLHRWHLPSLPPFHIPLSSQIPTLNPT
jgi:hypothetical protein